jgi:peroxiredoxin
VQLVELQGRFKDIQRSGLGLVAISYDPVPVLADFAKRRGITFPLLSDEGSRVIRQYGILNTTVPETNREQFGIPFPGTFIVDRQGVVTSRFFEEAYQERNTVGTVMARLGRGLSAPATKISGSHVDVTTYVSDQTVAPGTHFSIVLDVRPRDAQFPASEDFHFKPLNEHVRVYQKPFRIVQDVTIDASPDGVRALSGRDRVTLSGTLNYQACDDKVCFTPQSLPLTWTVSLKPLDRERVKER